MDHGRRDAEALPCGYHSNLLTDGSRGHRLTPDSGFAAIRGPRARGRAAVRGPTDPLRESVGVSRVWVGLRRDPGTPSSWAGRCAGAYRSASRIGRRITGVGGASPRSGDPKLVGGPLCGGLPIRLPRATPSAWHGDPCLVGGPPSPATQAVLRCMRKDPAEGLLSASRRRCSYPPRRSRKRPWWVLT